jgi:hypothetical protein
VIKSLDGQFTGGCSSQSASQARAKMFEDNSYVVRPPKGLVLKEQLALEAIAFSMRAAMAALVSIRAITDAHAEAQSAPDESPKNYPEDQTVALYSNVWEIVDQIHVVRELLALVKFEESDEPAFLQKYEVAIRLRNKMDHLQGNLSNLAENKKLRPTIFGSLSYYKYRGKRKNPDGKTVRYGNVFAVPFGTITHGGHSFPMVNPVGHPISYKTDLFEFSAFDLTFPIFRLSEDLPNLAKHLDEAATRHAKKVAEERKVSEGVDTDSSLAQSTSLIVRCEFTYDA